MGTFSRRSDFPASSCWFWTVLGFGAFSALIDSSSAPPPCVVMPFECLFLCLTTGDEFWDEDCLFLVLGSLVITGARRKVLPGLGMAPRLIFRGGAPRGTGDLRKIPVSAGWHTQASIFFRISGIFAMLLSFGPWRKYALSAELYWGKTIWSCEG